MHKNQVELLSIFIIFHNFADENEMNFEVLKLKTLKIYLIKVCKHLEAIKTINARPMKEFVLRNRKKNEPKSFPNRLLKF